MFRAFAEQLCGLKDPNAALFQKFFALLEAWLPPPLPLFFSLFLPVLHEHWKYVVTNKMRLIGVVMISSLCANQICSQSLQATRVTRTCLPNLSYLSSTQPRTLLSSSFTLFPLQWTSESEALTISECNKCCSRMVHIIFQHIMTVMELCQIL